MVTRQTGMTVELLLQSQIRSVIIEYNFFVAGVYFRQSVRRLACVI